MDLDSDLGSGPDLLIRMFMYARVCLASTGKFAFAHVLNQGALCDVWDVVSRILI